jgi:hypothetical protein
MADEGKLGLRIYAMVGPLLLVMTRLIVSFIVEIQPRIAVTRSRRFMMPKVSCVNADGSGAKK